MVVAVGQRSSFPQSRPKTRWKLVSTTTGPFWSLSHFRPEANKPWVISLLSQRELFLYRILSKLLKSLWITAGRTPWLVRS